MARDLLFIVRSTGLDDREAQLYLAGLRLKSAPASEYARKTGLHRVTAYNSLEALVRRGLFTLDRRPRSRWYAPVPPEFLVLEAEKNAAAIRRALPELAALQDARRRRPQVRFFEGWDGVRRVYEDTLTASSEILNFANSAVVRARWPSYDQEYVDERVKRKIHLRGIAPDDEMGRKVHGEDRKKLREIRLVPARDFDFANEINVYDDKLAICSFGAHENGDDCFGVIIESREVAETQRQIFEMAWRYAKQSKKPHR